MNKCHFVGRIATDLELKEGNGTPYLRFRIAVRRPVRSKDGEVQTDFVPCVAFNKTAEFIAKYFKKGEYIALSTAYRTDQYQTQDGATRYTHDFFVEEANFCSPASRDNGNGEAPATERRAPAASEQPIPAYVGNGTSVELPF